MPNFMVNDQERRWFYPIGPAPKGWEPIKGCSTTIPHTECSEQWQNDEMNSEHYYEGEIMWVVYDTETGWSEEDWRFASFLDAVLFMDAKNAEADYDHFAWRRED